MRVKRINKLWISAMLMMGSMASHLLWNDSRVEAAGNTHVRVLVMGKTSHYNTSKDVITFTAKSSGFGVGFQEGPVFKSVYSISSGDSLLSSLDDFFIVVQETNTYQTALSTLSTLQTAGYPGSIIVLSRQGKTIYQVQQGYYESMSDAQTALQGINTLGFQSKLAGFFRLSAGSFSNPQDAQTKIASLQNLGYDAYLTGRVSSGGGISYEVWVGDSSTAALRDQLGTQLSAQGIQTLPATFTDDYALFKPDGSIPAMDGTPHIRMHSFLESTGQELELVSQGTPGIIRLQEKGITYRGNLIVRGLNGRLAVVNDIGIDDYVRGVVPKEMSTGWPLEALKAQAVAARTYALRQPANNWSIAAVDDSTYSQAYGGYTWEFDDTNAAVDQTSGQVLMYDNGTPNDTSDDVLVDTLFSANHGGRTADPSEVWGNAVPYLTSVDSPYDQISLDVHHEAVWNRVMFPSGFVGYLRSDFVTANGTKTASGLPIATVNTDGANVRATPDIINGKIINTTHLGDSVVIIDSTREFDDYAWMMGPYTPSYMQNLLQLSSPVTSLSVVRVGPSGRPLQIQANGTPIPVSVPDDYRGMFGTLSNLFTIEETGAYRIQGATTAADYPAAKTQGGLLYAIGASTTAPVNNGNSSFVMMGASGTPRVATEDPTFVIHGNGNGHGLGMSQWGAYGMAKAGYNYQDILRHYYTTHVYLKTVN